MITTKAKDWILKQKKPVMIGILTFSMLLISFTVTPLNAYAWDWDDIVFKVKDIDKEKAIAFLSNEWIDYANFIGSIVQSLAGWTIKGLLILVSLLEGLIPETFSLFDLLKDAGLNEFAASMMKGLLFAILGLVIAYLGIRTIIFHKPPRFKSVGVNVIIMIGLLGGLNELMADMQKMSTDFYKAAASDEKTKDGLAWNIVKHNTADLVYLSRTGFDPIKKESKTVIENDSSGQKNGLTKEMYLGADLGDLITTDVVDKLKDKDGVAEETKFLAYKITNDGDKEALQEISSSMFNPFKDTFESGYVRYPMNFWTIFCSLLSLGVAYVFTLFVFVMTIFEIGIKKLVAPFVFVTDIESGQKTKMVIQDIFSAFLLIGFTGVTLRFYTIAVNFLGDANINAVLYVISMICLTIALIKGSESIMKYFGVDVGLKDGKNNLMAAIGGLAAAKGVGKGLANMGRSAKDKLTGSNGQSRDDTPKRSEGSSDEENAGQDPNGANSGQNNAVPLKKLARNTGTALGYMRNRGAGGMLNDAGNMVADAAGGVVDKGKEKVSDAANSVKDNVKGTVAEFKGGQAEGQQKALENNDRQLLEKIGKDIIQNSNSDVDHSTAGAPVTPQSGTQAVERELNMQD
ncbi:hypothetical protein IEE_05540, partial [Bacillus cereus BAG5X1-1]